MFAQCGQFPMSIAIGMSMPIMSSIGIIMSPSQHHIIAGFDPPAVYTTAIGSSPVTSKYTLPVDVWP